MEYKITKISLNIGHYQDQTPPVAAKILGFFVKYASRLAGCRSERLGAMVNERLIGEVVGAEPFVTAVAAFAEGWGYGAEEVSVGGAVVVHYALEALAVAG